MRNAFQALLSKFSIPHQYVAENSRYLCLQKAYVAYQESGSLLSPQLLATGDDLGIYYYIPLLTAALDIPLNTGIDLFFYVLIGVSTLLGMAGLFLLGTRHITRFLAVCTSLLLALYACRVTGAYTVAYCVTMATVPLSLVLVQRRQDRCFAGFLMLAGMFAAFANQLRSHTGTAPLLFIGCLLLLDTKRSLKTKILLAVALATGTIATQWGFNHIVQRQLEYHAQRNPCSLAYPRSHTFWHQIYLGLGFLTSPINRHQIPYYEDGIAFAKAESIQPGVAIYSDAYEEIIKQEVVSILRQDWQFVLQNVFAKLGIIFFFFLYFGNVGLLAAYSYRKPRQIDTAFFAALSFSTLFGILTIPTNYYLLGFISLTVLFNVISISYALEQGCLQDIKHQSTAWLKAFQQLARGKAQ